MANVLAQPGPGTCVVNVSVEDATCSDGNCEGRDGCQPVTFTVPCAGCFCLEVQLDCHSNSCKNCQACANVYQGEDLIQSSNCHNNICLTGLQCSMSCSSNGFDYFKLVPNTEYKLFVCKRPCPDFAITCEDCDESCVARAILHQLPLAECD